MDWFIILLEAVMHRLWRAARGRHHPDLHLNWLSETCFWQAYRWTAYRWTLEENSLYYRLAWVYLCPRGERSSWASWTLMCWVLSTSCCWMRFKMTLLSERWSVMACSRQGPLGGCFSHRKSNKTVRCFYGVSGCLYIWGSGRLSPFCTKWGGGVGCGGRLQGFSCRSQPAAEPPWRWDVHS